MLPMPLTARRDSTGDSQNQRKNTLEINSDFNVSVVVKNNLLNGRVLPVSGVRQQCFERMTKHKSRMTTLVQFPAGRILKKIHPAEGVEFFVLSGVFSDADKQYVAGSYVRDPVGSYRKPFTKEGCTVLFKSGQFQPLDRKRVVINSAKAAVRWSPVGEPGVSRLDLHCFSEEEISLYRIRSECWVTFRQKNYGVEVFVCEGSILVSSIRYGVGDWLRYPCGSKLKISAIGSVCLYVKKSVFPK